MPPDSRLIRSLLQTFIVEIRGMPQEQKLGFPTKMYADRFDELLRLAKAVSEVKDDCMWPKEIRRAQSNGNGPLARYTEIATFAEQVIALLPEEQLPPLEE